MSGGPIITRTLNKDRIIAIHTGASDRLNRATALKPILDLFIKRRNTKESYNNFDDQGWTMDPNLDVESYILLKYLTPGGWEEDYVGVRGNKYRFLDVDEEMQDSYDYDDRQYTSLNIYGPSGSGFETAALDAPSEGDIAKADFRSAGKAQPDLCSKSSILPVIPLLTPEKPPLVLKLAGKSELKPPLVRRRKKQSGLPRPALKDQNLTTTHFLLGTQGPSTTPSRISAENVSWLNDQLRELSTEQRNLFSRIILSRAYRGFSDSLRELDLTREEMWRQKMDWAIALTRSYSA